MIQEELQIYIHLLEDENLYPIILGNFLKSIDSTLPLVEKALKNPDFESKSKLLIRLYNDLNLEYSKEKLVSYTYRDYINILELWQETSLFLFDLEKTELSIFQQNIIEKIIVKIKSQLTWRMSPLEIVTILNHEFSTYFIIDTDEKVSLNNFETILNTRTLNQYTLSLFYLIVAERLELPIFGLPISDSIILCYSKEHCNHNELVYEDDILFYFTPGPFGLIYTLEDLELYALSLGHSLSLRSKLPKSNIYIVQQWCINLRNKSKDFSNYQNLSNKYEQLNEMFKIS